MNIKEMVTILIFVLLTGDSISTFLCRREGLIESNKRMKCLFEFFENIFKIESGGEFIVNILTRIFAFGIFLLLHFTMSDGGYVLAMVIPVGYIGYAVWKNTNKLI